MTFTQVNGFHYIDGVVYEVLRDFDKRPKRSNEEMDREIEDLLYQSGFTTPHHPMPITMHLADKMVLSDMGLFRAANNY